MATADDRKQDLSIGLAELLDDCGRLMGESAGPAVWNTVGGF